MKFNKIKFKVLLVTVFCVTNILVNESMAQNSNTTKAKLETMGFKKIKPSELKGNTFKMFADDWALVTAGNVDAYNTMTIGWGDFGVLWGRDIITVYVSSSRYTKGFMDENDFFTVEFFDEQYRDALTYLGSHSGRDENKVEKAELTPIFTDKGNATFKESRIIIEAKKIYAHEFDVKKLPEDVKTWYKKRNLGLHTMYIGEIIGVWIKE